MATRERAIPFGIINKGPELNFQVVGGLPVYPEPIEEVILPNLDFTIDSTTKRDLDVITISASGKKNFLNVLTLQYISCETMSVVDCSLYNSLVFTISECSIATDGYIRVGVSSTAVTKNNVDTAFVSYKDVTKAGTVVVDISDISESLFVTIFVCSGSATTSVTCTDIVLSSVGQGVTEKTLPEASASGGNYYAGNNTRVITSSTVWDLSGCDSLTMTWINDMSVNYWTNPMGSVTNSTRYCYLAFADGSELLVGTGTTTQTTTIDLSSYTDSQKASVQLRGKLDYYLSTTTNAACYGSISATNVTALCFQTETGESQPPVENPIENTIWVNTDADITEWVFSDTDPRSNLYTLDGATNGALINSSGAVDTSFTNFYATDYIAIPEGCTSLSLTQYYTTTGGYNAWYTAEKTFISAFQKQSGTTELTVPSNASYMRLSQQKASEPNGLILIAAPKEGTVWIDTGNSSFVGFNALKENKLMVLPIAIMQGDGSKWVFRDGHIYQNGEWITFFAPKNEGCWTFKKYASGASTPHPSDFVGKTVTDTKMFKDSDLSTSMAIGDSYSAMCTAYLYFDTDTTLSISFTTDDNGSVTLNGTLLGDLTSCTAKSISCPFKAGWNELVVCFTEGSGGDGWTTSPRLYNHTSVTAMYASLY